MAECVALERPAATDAPAITRRLLAGPLEALFVHSDPV
jgi:hypothetical protein